MYRRAGLNYLMDETDGIDDGWLDLGKWEIRHTFKNKERRRRIKKRSIIKEELR